MTPEETHYFSTKHLVHLIFVPNRLAKKYNIESLSMECKWVLGEMEYNWDLVMTVLPVTQAMGWGHRLDGPHVSTALEHISHRETTPICDLASQDLALTRKH